MDTNGLYSVMTLLHIFRKQRGDCALCEKPLLWSRAWEIHGPSGLHDDAAYCSPECCNKAIDNILEERSVSAQTNAVGRD